MSDGCTAMQASLPPIQRPGARLDEIGRDLLLASIRLADARHDARRHVFEVQQFGGPLHDEVLAAMLASVDQ